MQKLSSDVVDHVKAKLPAKPFSDEAEALAKARAKLRSSWLSSDPRQEGSSV